MRVGLFAVMVMVFSVFSYAEIALNSASKKELASLKGINKKEAKYIVKYRKKHCFKSLNELSKVKKIGKKEAKRIIEMNRGNLVLGECE